MFQWRPSAHTWACEIFNRYFLRFECKTTWLCPLAVGENNISSRRKWVNFGIGLFLTNVPIRSLFDVRLNEIVVLRPFASTARCSLGIASHVMHRDTCRKSWKTNRKRFLVRSKPAGKMALTATTATSTHLSVSLAGKELEYVCTRLRALVVDFIRRTLLSACYVNTEIDLNSIDFVFNWNLIE